MYKIVCIIADINIMCIGRLYSFEWIKYLITQINIYECNGDISFVEFSTSWCYACTHKYANFPGNDPKQRHLY